MLKKYVSTAILAVLIACNSGSVTGPTPTPNTPAPVAQEAPAPPVANPPSAAPNDQTPTWEGYIKPFAGWYVKNLSGNISTFTAYYTSFDNQSLSLGEKSGSFNSGDFFEGTFNKTCVQVDLTYGKAGDAPFLFGYVDNLGNVVKQINADIRKACAPVRVPDPECVNVPTTRTVVSYGEFNNTGYLGEKCGSRNKITTTYTLNSCTKVEAESVVNGTDTLTCSVEPNVGICHTENPKNCKWEQRWYKKADFTGGSKDNQQGEYIYPRYELDCDNINDDGFNSDTSDRFKLYQCQNKTDKKTGHIPNHNGGGDHADYLGACKLATVEDHTSPEICYNINGTPQ